MLSLITATDVQNHLAEYLKNKRKSLKLSRNELSQRSTVPASTIKHFETTAKISLRQFLLLWQTVDDLARVNALTKQDANHRYKSIDEVLKDA